ncbi:MAG: hypothetical protein M5U28_24220 [Sandaracinaceae bacterium]|nr:hypothetical protein [Sandaracinaceae bacterium]
MARRSVTFFALLALGCQGVLVGSGPDARVPGVDGGAGRDAGRPPDPDAGRSADAGRASDAGRPGFDASDPGFDAGSCGAAFGAITLTPLSGVGGGPYFAAPTDTDGAVVASTGSAGARLARYSGAGALVGAAVDVAGNGLFGFDASADTWTAMVSRGGDALYLVGVEPSGATRFEIRLLGEVDHDVTNNEWFGGLLRAGRVLWTGSRWAAYYTVQRLWPDGVAHYGDQLRFFDASGADDGTAWGWGCSHSMEVRIEHNGATLAPVCASDCYPAKGIHVNHRSGMLYPDEGGSNCAGGYGTSLGDVVPVSDGFFVSFTATDARASHDVAVVHVGNDYSIGAVQWLTTDDFRDANVRSARYGAGFVVAWSGSGAIASRASTRAARWRRGPSTRRRRGLSGSSDFFVFSSGDVGWVTGGGALARLRACP